MAAAQPVSIKRDPDYFTLLGHLDRWEKKIGKWFLVANRPPEPGQGVDHKYAKAGRLAALAIANVRIHLNKDLFNKKISDLGKEDRERFEQLQAFVGRFREGKVGHISKFEQAVKKWILDFPSAPGKPKVTADPEYVGPNESDKWRIHFDGSLQYATKGSSLTIAGKKFDALSSDPQDLWFTVDVTPLAYHSHQPVELDIPLETGTFRSAIEHAVFRLWMGVMPRDAGSLAIFYRPEFFATHTTVFRKVTKEFSVSLKKTMQQDPPNKGWVTHYLRAYGLDEHPFMSGSIGTDGISISDIKCTLEDPELYRVSISIVEREKVTIIVKLDASEPDTDYTVSFKLNFTAISAQLPGTTPHTTSLEKLPWNKPIPLPVPQGRDIATIIYTYDGTRYQFGGRAVHHANLKQNPDTLEIVPRANI